MENVKPYNDFGDFLRKLFPYKVQKISINAGFTCPNRDGSKGWGGCTYCNNQTFSPEYCHTEKSVTEQLEEGIRFFSRKYPEMKYLAYFQAYTNTYDELSSLKAKYEEALSYPGVVGLIVGTRPDCMPEALLDYFTALSKEKFVMIEYGLESTLDKTLIRINRGHTYEESETAIRRTAERGIYTGAHLILGLPGESREEILHHADRLSALAGHNPETASVATDPQHPYGKGICRTSGRVPSVHCRRIYRPRDRLHRKIKPLYCSREVCIAIPQRASDRSRLGT